MPLEPPAASGTSSKCGKCQFWVNYPNKVKCGVAERGSSCAWPEVFESLFECSDVVVASSFFFFSKDYGFVYVLHGWLMHRHQCDRWRTEDPNIPSQERSWGTLTFADYLKWQTWMMYRAQCCLMILHSINRAAGFLFTCSVFAQSARGMLKIPLVFICGYKYCTCFGCWMFWNLNCAWLGFFMIIIILFYFP